MDYFKIASKSVSGKVAYNPAGEQVFVPKHLRDEAGDWGLRITKQIGLIKRDAEGEPILEDGQVIPLLNEDGIQRTQPRVELSAIGDFKTVVSAKNAEAIALKTEQKLINQLADEMLAGFEVPANLATQA